MWISSSVLKLWDCENNKALFFSLTWAQNCLLQFYIWIWLDGACSATTSTFSICGSTVEVWRQQQPPKKRAWSPNPYQPVKMFRVNTTWWGEFTYTLQRVEGTYWNMFDLLFLFLNHHLDTCPSTGRWETPHRERPHTKILFLLF